MMMLIAALGVLLALALLLGLDGVFQMTFNHGTDNINKSVTITGDEKIYAEISIPAAGNDDYVIGGDPDNVKGYMISSDQNVTLVTTNNPAGTPDTIAIVAGEPLVWHNKMVWTNGHFANRSPWTSWNFANPGATAATIGILIIRDSTP